MLTNESRFDEKPFLSNVINIQGLTSNTGQDNRIRNPSVVYIELYWANMLLVI